jgi:Zn-dependent alcohol dehydrogenase
MRAALHTEIGKPLSVVNDVEFISPKKGQVLIRTEYCGICHSDVSVMDSLDLTPMILGHEAAGVVEERLCLGRYRMEAHHLRKISLPCIKD